LLLGVDPQRQATNAEQPSLVLFVVDVSGSMSAKLDRRNTRIIHCIETLHRLLESPGLQHPATRVGILRADFRDPIPVPGATESFVKTFVPMADAPTRDDLVRSITSLVPTADHGTNLRVAHYRGLQVLKRTAEALQAREPAVTYQRYLIMLSDCFLDEPQLSPDELRQVGPAVFRQAVDMWNTLQHPQDAAYREWQELCADPRTTTLVVEPYNPQWHGGPVKIGESKNSPNSLFPGGLAVSGIDTTPTSWEGRSAIEGRVIQAGEGVASDIAVFERRSALDELDASAAHEGVSVDYIVTWPNGRRLESSTQTGPRGDFFIPVEWSSGDPSAAEVTLHFKRSGLSPQAKGPVPLHPGQHLVYGVLLAPQTDWGLYLLWIGGIAVVLLLTWPREVSTGSGVSSAVIWMFQSVDLHSPGTYRRVGKVTNCVLNWLTFDREAFGAHSGQAGPGGVRIVLFSTTLETIGLPIQVSISLASPARLFGRSKGPFDPLRP
jgi:hypothetical protein